MFQINLIFKLINPEVAKLGTAFLQTNEKYILSAQEIDKLGTLSKNKIYDLKIRGLKKEANDRHVAQSSNKVKAIWNIINERAKK